MRGELSRATIGDVLLDTDGAAQTGRCLPYGDTRDEWCEHGGVDGVPVRVYYLLTQDDDERIGEGAEIDWAARVDRIEIDLPACERQAITHAALAALVARLG